jgi:hypothetical protein
MRNSKGFALYLDPYRCELVTVMIAPGLALAVDSMEGL